VRVITLNTWKNDGDYRRRLPRMRDGLASLAPDVVCLQECFAAAGIDTAAWLAQALGFELHAAPARAKIRRHDGRDLQSTSGLAILTRHSGVSASCALTSDPADGERIAQRLDLTIDGRPLRILNLHLTHLRDRATLRTMQLAEALAWAESHLAGGLVVAGDLNATAADAALAPLGLEPQPATLQGARWPPSARGALAIDHCVLLRPGAWRPAAALRGCDTPDTAGWFPSDHACVGLALT
jgi:endonuclease/exonuclease/phosphatase family metal-dependent hydrolase